jgi:uncharacterized repeat protein (TIGR03803 family)
MCKIPVSKHSLYVRVMASAVIALSLLAPLVARAQEQTLYSFSAISNGSEPNSLVLGADGNLYGTAASGGAHDVGVVFQLTPVTGGGWTESVLYSFTGGSDGKNPGTLIFGADGNLYGTAYNGGNANCPAGCGTVFQLIPGSGTFSVIHTFQGRTDGHFPRGLVFDAAGNLYGTTFQGGTSNAGLVYQLVPTTSGPWTENLLYTFMGGKDGTWPNPRLTLDSAGNVYGSTQIGGVAPNGYGTAFKLSLISGAWKRMQIAYFIGGGAQGFGTYPNFGLIADGAGNVYGTTSGGGGGDSGNVFRLEPSPLGGRWQLNVLHFFLGGPQGSVPNALVRDSADNLFGTAFTGGSTNCPVGCGTIFRLQPASSGPWSFTSLYSFTGENDGANPNSLISDAAGNLYGTTAGGGSSGLGAVFELPAN